MTHDSEKAGPDSTSPRENGAEDEWSFFNKVRSDVLRKKLEAMLKKDGVVKNLVSELKLPREIVAHLMSQIDDTKQAALGVISREVRLFFENTNLSDELAKLLSQLSFEVSTRVRFVRNEPEEPRSSKKAEVSRTIRLKHPRNTGAKNEAPKPADTESDTKSDTEFDGE